MKSQCNLKLNCLKCVNNGVLIVTWMFKCYITYPRPNWTIRGKTAAVTTYTS